VYRGDWVALLAAASDDVLGRPQLDAGVAAPGLMGGKSMRQLRRDFWMRGCNFQRSATHTALLPTSPEAKGIAWGDSRALPPDCGPETGLAGPAPPASNGSRQATVSCGRSQPNRVRFAIGRIRQIRADVLQPQFRAVGGDPFAITRVVP